MYAQNTIICCSSPERPRYEPTDGGRKEGRKEGREEIKKDGREGGTKGLNVRRRIIVMRRRIPAYARRGRDAYLRNARRSSRSENRELSSVA